MKTTLLHVRRLAMAAALLGTVVAPRAASAQSQLDASEAGGFLGSWAVTLESDYGPLEFPLELTDQGGKVAASVGALDPSGAGGMQAVTDVSKSGDGLVLRYEFDAQGQVMDVSLTLTPSGDDLTAVFELGGGVFSAGGTAKKAG